MRAKITIDNNHAAVQIVIRRINVPGSGHLRISNNNLNGHVVNGIKKGRLAALEDQQD